MQTGIQLLIQPSDKDEMNFQVTDRIRVEVPLDTLGNGSQLLYVVGVTNTASLIFMHN